MSAVPEDNQQDQNSDEFGENQEGMQVEGDEEMARLQSECSALYAQLARVQADFQNARKRLEADKEQAVQYANSSLIKSLLPVIDNFERALGQDPAKIDVPSLLKGMQIVHDQWLAVLAQQTVMPIAPKPGDLFDPGSMQALLQQPSKEFKSNHVTQLLGKGYSLHGRTLRPAQVAVAAE